MKRTLEVKDDGSIAIIDTRESYINQGNIDREIEHIEMELRNMVYRAESLEKEYQELMQIKLDLEEIRKEVIENQIPETLNIEIKK